LGQPGLTQPSLIQLVSMGAEGPGLGGGAGQGGGTGPQQMPGPGGFQGGSPFAGHDPGSTALDPIPADLAGPGGSGGPGMHGGGQPPFGGPGGPDQPGYGGQEPQPAYGAADYGPGEPSYGGDQDQGYSDTPQFGSPEPSYGSDPLGGRRDGGYDLPSDPGPRGGDPRVSDPLGLPLGEHSGPPASPMSPPASPPPASPPPASPPPASAPAAHGGSGGGSDTDGHRLPSVDELLQRIQSDRQRSASAASSSDTGGSYGAGSLNDPLGDPLGTGSFGTTGGSGAPSGDGQGQRGDGGYPTAPAYGGSPRYDDPLGGGREPFGAFGGGEGGGSGVYGDFSGSSYNGGADPLAAPHDPNAQGGYQ